MKQTLTSAFAYRANAVLACSAAILLAACGGNDTMGTPVQTAALVTNASAGTSTGSSTSMSSGASSAGATAGSSDAAAASAAAQPLSTESAGIDSYQPDAVTTVNPDAPADSSTAPASAADASH